MSGISDSVVRPRTGRVLVTELSGPINPTPKVKYDYDEPETEVGLYLSPKHLKLLCGTQDLSQVTSLEVCVNTQEQTLGNFGAHLPKLAELKLDNSVIMSVRDLGTSLFSLQVLWMSRCCLQDLNGISSLLSIKELYLAYNCVSDLSQIGLLEHLRLLDLEGNDVDDLIQVQYLGLCGQLQVLTLEGNPVCLQPNTTAAQMGDYNYRAAVRELIPQLCYLDNVRVGDEVQGSSSTMGEDWVVLRDSIRGSSWVQEKTPDVSGFSSRPGSACRPGTSSSSGSRPRTSARPSSAASTPISRPGSAESVVEEESSHLVHGAGDIVYCGNPVRAIRARREKLKTAPTWFSFTPSHLPIYVPERSYDLQDGDGKERGDVFAELRAWREQHSRRLQEIKKDRAPQVLMIQHGSDKDSDGEDGSDDRSDEEWSQEPSASSQSPFQSLTPDLHTETFNPETVKLSLSPDNGLFPSPPSNIEAGCKQLSRFRAQRLRINKGSSAHLVSLNGDQLRPEASVVTRQDQQGKEQERAHLRTSDWRQSRVNTVTRPHTAQAALQKHQQHHKRPPCRGSSHTECE
ncbi:leucine-rich repeat-containing protein 56 [Synchiropus splendidus]|uniref:leucine-rich repeat-containing protein 56 n=1 Tax=Synchiropus splendidus TaxID=270530 RepID=UPI00237D8338|nr:leucine-rich repeat-containing protein 56 [Synchiropus splendidus]